jgi:lipopolysaccharide/colanic/teichoic acid biosynthesis glycosyltransferase
MLGYLAAGRPVVVSVDADSDTAQCIRDGNCGLVVATQDVAGMVQAIKKMMAPGEAVRYGTEARQYFLKHYSRSAGTGRYIRLLREVCDPKKSQTHEGHMGNTKIYISPLGRRIVAARARPVKRAVDFLTAMAALIVVSPILMVSAILVKLTSKGPVFYMGERVGRGGKPYKMIKFRSMKVGAPSQLTKDGKMIVTREDPRVTGIGRLLRASKADELPQFLNVLKGDMSFVGPRSGLPEFEKNYSDLAYERLRIRPGVTGIGSVLGGRHMSNECLYELEARYVEHQNLWLDFLIVLMTPVYILFGRSIPRFVLRRYIKGIEFHMLTGESTET